MENSIVSNQNNFVNIEDKSEELVPSKSAQLAPRAGLGPAEVLDEVQTSVKLIEEKLLNSIKQISARSILNLKSIQNPSNSLDNLAVCILLLFDAPVPKSFPWEKVSVLLSNPGPIIQQIRKTPDLIKSKHKSDACIRDILSLIPHIKDQDLSSHKLKKDLEFVLNFIKISCDYHIILWPDSIKPVEIPKRKFQIPQSSKKTLENSLQAQINKEKKIIQEIKYKERLMKWEEERNIKKEFKLEELRELQREINYSKSIEDEYKKNQASKKKEERDNHAR
jgi:hypothetical protein